MEIDSDYMTAADVQGTDGDTEAEQFAGTARLHHKAGICQVKGCGVDLTLFGKAYYVRKRACPMHLAAPEVVLKGCDKPVRFCHQCGKFESVEAFEGLKRSCAVRLLRRRAHQQQ